MHLWYVITKRNIPKIQRRLCYIVPDLGMLLRFLMMIMYFRWFALSLPQYLPCYGDTSPSPLQSTVFFVMLLRCSISVFGRYCTGAAV